MGTQIYDAIKRGAILAGNPLGSQIYPLNDKSIIPSDAQKILPEMYDDLQSAVSEAFSSPFFKEYLKSINKGKHRIGVGAVIDTASAMGNEHTITEQSAEIYLNFQSRKGIDLIRDFVEESRHVSKATWNGKKFIPLNDFYPGKIPLPTNNFSYSLKISTLTPTDFVNVIALELEKPLRMSYKGIYTDTGSNLLYWDQREQYFFVSNYFQNAEKRYASQDDLKNYKCQTANDGTFINIGSLADIFLSAEFYRSMGDPSPELTARTVGVQLYMEVLRQYAKFPTATIEGIERRITVKKNHWNYTVTVSNPYPMFEWDDPYSSRIYWR